MKMNKAYKFRIYPNSLQRKQLAGNFGCVRLVYNHYLAVRKEAYENEHKSISYSDTAKDLVRFKKENPFLMDTDSISLQQALRHLDTAFKNFFRDKNVGYPRFKSKKNHHYSYSTVCVNGNIRLNENSLILPKLKAVRIKKHRTIPDTYILKSVTVSKTPSGKYVASLLYEYEKEIQEVSINRAVGLDFSMHELFVSSEESIHTDKAFLHRLKNSLNSLAAAQRRLSNCEKGSNRYIKQRYRVAKLHEHISNQRNDYLHKTSRQITNAFDVVCIESLDMKEMSASMNFGRSVADNSWGAFTNMLSYKLSENGKKLVKVDKWFPSSKTCSNCGHVYEELTLNERTWTCSCCNTVHDRDRNASINIKREGLRQLTA